MSLVTVRSLMIAGLAATGFVATAYADRQAVAPAGTVVDPTFPTPTPAAAYPPQSRKHKEAGIVHMKICVDAAGRVTKADLAQSSGFPNLDNAALKWVKDIKFNPATKASVPVALCDFRLTYEFQVTKGPDRQQQTNNPFDIGPPSGLAAGP